MEPLSTLLDMLVRLVLDNKITEAQALALLRRVQSGEPSLSPLFMPVDPAQLIQPVSGDDIVEGGADYYRLSEIGQPSRRRETLAGVQRVAFQQSARTLANMIGTVPLVQWQAAMAFLVRANLVTSAMLGLGSSELPPALLDELDIQAQLQAAYLSRFGDEIALAWLIDEPYGLERIGRRSELYAGAGWAAYWRGQLLAWGDTGGWIYHYQSRDTDGVCTPCLVADHGSPYLWDKCPLPGVTCLGGGRCHCRLRREYNPDKWRELTELRRFL